MPRIFISYRRADSNSITGRIHDSLEAAFGGDNIFKDVDDIPLGSDFREILDHQISLNEVLLVIIGKQWLSVTDAEGLRRLDNPSDFVSIEIESALKRDDMLIIPVLVNSANMPTESDLPPSLESLAFLNAATVRDDPDYHRDVERLIQWLRSYGDSLANVELILANINARQTWTEIVEQLEQARKAAGTAKTLQAKVNDAHQSWEQIKGTMVSELKSTSQQSPQVVEKPVASVYGRKKENQSNYGLYLGGIVMGIVLLAAVLGGYLIISQLTNGTDTLAQNGVASNAEWESQYPDGFIREFDGLEMVLVPAGCFMMGSEDGGSDEVPVHEQCFDQPFWIDRYEVSNAQYGSVTEISSCLYASSEPNQPRNCVDWFEATAFCESRDARLPTEAEWEYAARGPDNLVYPWGAELTPEFANYADTSADETFEVGSYPGGASWVGALDMSGNVWEWVSTIYDQDEYAYPYDKEDGREDADNTNSLRVMRGGAFNESSFVLRGANRIEGSPDDGTGNDGFRCARS